MNTCARPAGGRSPPRISAPGCYLEALQALRKRPVGNKGEVKKELVETIAVVAKRLGNTPPSVASVTFIRKFRPLSRMAGWPWLWCQARGCAGVPLRRRKHDRPVESRTEAGPQRSRVSETPTH